ncbi:MAG: DMT family transporter [Beijerinckiaceae bacterium]|nr:DMT family transporter [Beijerinckiaceae bacterium]
MALTSYSRRFNRKKVALGRAGGALYLAGCASRFKRPGVTVYRGCALVTARGLSHGLGFVPRGPLRIDPFMNKNSILLLTSVAMIAFAANSLLCRIALRNTGIDAASFTLVRIVSGALMLGLIVRLRGGDVARHGNWPSSFALFVYAAGFSFAYLSLSAATGALLLFGAVQTTMIGYGLWCGERLSPGQTAGLMFACAGLIVLMLPGLAAPPLRSALLMVAAGMAWGVYSLRGRGGSDPAANTAGNFLRALPFAGALSLAAHSGTVLDGAGIGYAIASGALASGLGYAVWYAVLPGLRAANAATVQLSVPVIAALGGALFLGETMTPRLLLASVAILGGIAMVIGGWRFGRRAA